MLLKGLGRVSARPPESFQFLLGFYSRIHASVLYFLQYFQFLLGFYKRFFSLRFIFFINSLSIPFRILQKNSGHRQGDASALFQFLLGFYKTQAIVDALKATCFQFLLGFYRTGSGAYSGPCRRLSIPFRILLTLVANIVSANQPNFQFLLGFYP